MSAIWSDSASSLDLCDAEVRRATCWDLERMFSNSESGIDTFVLFFDDLSAFSDSYSFWAREAIFSGSGSKNRLTVAEERVVLPAFDGEVGWLEEEFELLSTSIVRCGQTRCLVSELEV
jgi:hypothetical protein